MFLLEFRFDGNQPSQFRASSVINDDELLRAVPSNCRKSLMDVITFAQAFRHARKHAANGIENHGTDIPKSNLYPAISGLCDKALS